jgi:hypothetical protein
MVKLPEKISKILTMLRTFLFSKLFFYCIYFCIFAIIFILINSSAVNVPYWDQWRTVDALFKYHENTLTFFDFWVPHNESRMIFPLLIEFGIALLTNLNVIYEVYLSFFLIFIISIILYKNFSEQFTNLKLNYFYFIPVLLILVSFRQYTNYLWGFIICIYLCILCVILSIYFLIHHNSPKGFVIAVITAFIASFSFVAGLSILPIGILILITLGRKKSELIGWICFCFFSLALFFWNWSQWEHTQILLTVDNIINYTLYLLVIIGSPLGNDIVSAAVFGLIILILSVITVYLIFTDNLLKSNYFWLFVLFFSFLCSVMNTIGRTFGGTANAFMSRYTPFAIVGIISLYCLILSLFNSSLNNQKNQKNSSLLFGSITILVIIGLFLGNIQGFQEFSARNPLGFPNDNLKFDQYYLLTYHNQPDTNLKFIYPSVDYLKPHIVKMEKYQLGVFRDNRSIDTIPVIHSQAIFNIERINSKKVTTGSNITINKNENAVDIIGWAIDGMGNKPAESVYISIDDKFDMPTIYSKERPDVSDYFKNANLKNCGFEAVFSPDILKEGVHTIKLKILTNHNEMYITEPVFVTIVNSSTFQ